VCDSIDFMQKTIVVCVREYSSVCESLNETEVSLNETEESLNEKDESLIPQFLIG
jgi:hypothetical protein